MNADFLIIGGGIAGVSAAARLSHLGSVTLLEAEGALAHHASGRSAALYEPRYGLPPVVALSMAGGDYLRSAPKVLSPRGLMIVARSEERALFEADIAEMDLVPVPVDEAVARVPVLNRRTVAHAALADHAWDIDTDLMLQGFLRSLDHHFRFLQLGVSERQFRLGGVNHHLSKGEFPLFCFQHLLGTNHILARLIGFQPRPFGFLSAGLNLHGLLLIFLIQFFNFLL